MNLSRCGYQVCLEIKPNDCVLATASWMLPSIFFIFLPHIFLSPALCFFTPES